jgi:hypothetical protein
MILLPKSWTLSRARFAVTMASWLLILLGCLAFDTSNCGERAWGGPILLWVGVSMLALLAISEPDIKASERMTRLILGVIVAFAGTLMLVGLLDELARSNCR